MPWDQAIPFFTRSELSCKGTGVIKLDRRLAVRLPQLRIEWGDALYPTSVCRTPEHNESVGGHKRSLHLTDNPTHDTDGCMAADIAWRNWSAERKLRFARLAWSLGWSVGLHDSFCHIDRRKDAGLAQASFLYGHWSDQFTPDAVIDG